MTKATAAEGDQMKYGPGWMFSRRATLKVFDNRLECGDWKVPFSDIEDAVLYSIRSNLFILGYVLKIQTEGRIFHFGLNWGKFWNSELPFPVQRQKGKLGYSALSIIIRAFILVYLMVWLWRWFT